MSSSRAPLVFEPEVKEVSVDQNRRRFRRGVLNPLEEGLLMGRRGGTVVDIRGYVDWLDNGHV